MAGRGGCQAETESGSRRRKRGIGKRLESGTSEATRGLSSASSRADKGRTETTRRGRRVVGPHPFSRKADSSQQPRVRLAAFTGVV